MLGSSAFRMSVTPGGALAGPWVKNSLWSTARAVPSLDQPFADTKSLADAVTGQSLVTFTRASSGTYVDSDGLIKTAATNEPRFDHNPTTGESLGLLVEEQRTNLLLQSEVFGTTWLQSNTNISSDAALSPSGLQVADKIIANTTDGQHFRRQDVAITASTSYSLSVYAKADGYNFLAISPGALAISDYPTWFDLSAGTVSTNTAGNTASIQNVGNGWYRCSVTRTTNVGQTTMSARYYVCNNANVSSFAGDNTSGVLLWGAQLEAGAFPTSYIPTTTAAATRSADVASITGTAFSSWYRQDEGTVFAEFSAAAYSTASLAISDGTNNNRIMIDRGSTGTRYVITNAGVAQSVGAQTPYVLNSFARSAIGFALDNCNLAVSGATQTVDTSASIPSSVDRLLLGVNAGGSGYGNGPIKRIAFWRSRLSDSTLASITQ